MGTVNQATESETADSAWKGLYRVGGAAALIMVVLFPPGFRVIAGMIGTRIKQSLAPAQME